MGLMTETPWEAATPHSGSTTDFHRENLKNLRKIQRMAKQKKEPAKPVKAFPDDRTKKYDHVQSRIREWAASSNKSGEKKFLRGHEKTGPFVEKPENFPVRVKRVSGVRARSRDSRNSPSDEGVPPLCFDDDEAEGDYCGGRGGQVLAFLNNFTRFSDVTVAERRSRIDTLISAINSTVPLNEGHPTRRSLHQTLRRFASVDQVSEVDSVISRQPPNWASKLNSAKSMANLKVKKSSMEDHVGRHAPLRKNKSVPVKPAKPEKPEKPDDRPESNAASTDEAASNGDNESVCLQGSEIDYVRANATGASKAGQLRRKETSRAQMALEKGQKAVAAKLEPPEDYKHGDVPQYLQDRKNEWKEAAERAEREKPDPDCPAGHRLLSDSERKEKLAEMVAKFDSLLRQMNSFPVRTDTLRSRQIKSEIESEINRLEEDIRAYERPRVFVKNN